MADDLIEIPCISLHRPWANWVACGLKPIETRTHQRFKSLVGKWVGIHAARTYDHSAVKMASKYQPVDRLISLEGVGLRGLIAVAYVQCHRELSFFDAKDALIECGTRRFGLRFSQIIKLRGYPGFQMRGHQGIFKAQFHRAALPDLMFKEAAP